MVQSINIDRLRKSCVLLLFVVVAALAVAQPAGHPAGHPGGHPGGYPGSGPGMRPGGRDFDANRMEQRGKEVKKKVIGSTFKVVGSLRDTATNEPMPFVNVAVLDAADSSYVRAASTNDEGFFEVTEVPAGNYLLRISYIGYKNKFVPFKVENNTALGTIYMKSTAETLKGVTIKADRPLYSMDGEKMIYNVIDDPSIQTGTTNDALQNAPGVEVDVEGNITLRGVSSVEIWLNDKPSKLTAENLKTFLESLPANALARIETITNPSAKYATEADAVINIVTTAHIKSNKFVSFGLNGATQPSLRPWVSYVWSKENLRISLYAAGNYRFGENTSSSSAVKFNTAFDTISRDSSFSENNSYSLGGNMALNLSYEFDTTMDLDVWLNTNVNRSINNGLGFFSFDESMQPGGFHNQYSSSNSDTSRSAFGMGGFYLTKKYNNEGKYLRVFGRGDMNRSSSVSWQDRDYEVYSNPFLSSYSRERVTRSAKWGSGLNMRYSNPLSKDVDLSFGLGVGYEHSDKDYAPVYSTLTGYDSIDPLRAYTFADDEYTVDGDVNFTRRWGAFTLELGLGASFRNLHFVYDVNPDASIHYPFLIDDTAYNFFTLRPSVHLSYYTESMHNFKLNYSLRMHNPSEYNLTTFRTYSDNSYTVGNRNLQAYYTHQAEAGWNKFFRRFGNVGLEAYANLSTNEINDLTDITDGVDQYLYQIVNFTTPYNMGMSYRYGLSANVMYRPSGFLNVRFYGNLYHSGYEMYYEKQGQMVTDGMTSYSLRVNMWTKVLNRYQIHAGASYSSPTQSLFATRKARYSFDLGLRSDFFNRKLSVFVNIQDLFNWGALVGSGSTNTNPYYLSNSTNKTINSRYISAGLTLRFGKMELERNAASESTGESASL